jgi:hypothetical protein
MTYLEVVAVFTRREHEQEIELSRRRIWENTLFAVARRKARLGRLRKKHHPFPDFLPKEKRD